jgi:hypothetical protein
MRPKVIGLAEEAKVEAFDASKSSKFGKKGTEAQEEECRQPLDQLCYPHLLGITRRSCLEAHRS